MMGRRIGALGVLMVMLASAIPSVADDVATYESLNAQLAGRGVTVGRKDGKKLKGTLVSITASTLWMKTRRELGSKTMVPLEVPVDEIAYIEDDGQIGPKVAGAMAGIGIGTLTGLAATSQLLDTPGADSTGIVLLFVGSVAAGGTTGSFIGRKASSERYYLGPEVCVPVQVPEPGAFVNSKRQIGISGISGVSVDSYDASTPAHGAQISVQFPATKRLTLIADFAFTSSNTVVEHRDNSWTDSYGITHPHSYHLDRSVRSYYGQLNLRYTWREHGRFRPYAEAGYGIARELTRETELFVDDENRREDVWENTRMDWSRLLGGVGCEFGVYRSLSVDVRAQFTAEREMSAHVSAGLKYGF